MSRSRGATSDDDRACYENAAEKKPVTVGVDTHLDSHVAVAVDYLGRRLGEMHVPTNEAGYAKLLRWAEKLGRPATLGIEGAGSFGAGLARFLRAKGTEVLEVGRPKRRDEHRSGKSDPIDAELAARAVLAGTAIGCAKDTEGTVEMIRVLRATRRSAVKARAQAAKQLATTSRCSRIRNGFVTLPGAPCARLIAALADA